MGKTKQMQKPNNTKGKKPLSKKIKINAISDMDQPILTSPQIDKLGVVIDMPADLHGQMVHELLCLIEGKEMGFKKLEGFKGYPLSIMIQCPDTNGVFGTESPGVWLLATSKDHPKPQIRLEFNPLKLFSQPAATLSADASEAIQGYLDGVFVVLCGMGFLEFLGHARVSSIEICRHILFRAPEDYLFKVRYAQTFQNFFDKAGKLGTINFGKRASNQTCIYNKAKQLHGKYAEQDSIRIERRLKLKKEKILDLWPLPNAFRYISIYSLKNDHPPKGVNAGHWTAWQDACRYRGITNAIKCQPSNLQNKLKKAVSENPVSWWSLDNATWEWLWHEALEESGLSDIPTNPPPLTLKAGLGEGL